MAGANRSKLVRISVRNIGCIGNDGVEIELDNVVCLVGKNNAGKSTILRAYELAKGSVHVGALARLSSPSICALSSASALNMRS